MFKTIINIFRVPELRNKVLFTLFMLAVYRIGFHIPIPGVDQERLAEMAHPGLAKLNEATDAEKRTARNQKSAEAQLEQSKSAAVPKAQADALAAAVEAARTAHDSAVENLKLATETYNRNESQGSQSTSGRLAQYVSLFSGGSLSQSTIFGLGVMPYISSSIIFQLLGTVIPSLEKLQKEGQTGQRKIQEWSRYVTVPLCIVQAGFWLSYMHSSNLVQQQFAHTASFWLMGLTVLTAGSIFLMWLGEQIDEYGLGNGVSLLILAGIIARMPAAVGMLSKMSNLSAVPDSSRPIGIGKITVLILCFVFIVAGSILITQAQRRIPIQQAKHTRGRRVYGGSKQFLPLRVNHGGVMPIIFAQSLMLFPQMLLPKLAEWFPNEFFRFLNTEFSRGGFFYLLLEAAMIYFFAYFWTTVQFQPKEMANQLRDYGSFIPGLRPGKRTADYLEKVMMRITYVGGAFLCIIAVIPSALSSPAVMDIPFQITAFLGGTGLLIVVSVALDMVQRIEANLLMRNYSGFLGGEGGTGKRIKGRQY